MDLSNLEPFMVDKPLIGMIHLLPTPGSPANKGQWTPGDIVDKAITDGTILVENGVDGIMVENYNDVPFYPEEVLSHTLGTMSIVVRDLVKELQVPVGVNILRNACKQALGIASVTGAGFIRCNVLTGTMFTNEGLLKGMAHDIIRYREHLQSGVRIYADIMVKHGYSPIPFSKFHDLAIETYDRGRADALIVSGNRTGIAPTGDMMNAVHELKKERPDCCLIAGSGITPTNISELGSDLDGFIVGSYFKEWDRTRDMHVIVPERVREICDAIKKLGN